MTLEGVPPYEMDGHDRDDELELEAFSEGLRAAFPAQPLPAEDEHVASMIAEAHLLADTGDPVVRPVSNADAPAAQVSWLSKQRRNRMQEERNRYKPRVLKVLAPATVFFALLGGVAWAGGLPAPLQQTASHVAGFAGLTLDDGTEGDATEVETPDPTDTDAPDATDNQDGDHQGEDTQDATSGEDNQGDDNNQGETSGDNSGEDNQGDDNNQGEDTQDSTSADDNQGDDNSQDSTSGPNTGEDNQGDSSGPSDNSGDSSGDSGSDGSGAPAPARAAATARTDGSAATVLNEAPPSGAPRSRPGLDGADLNRRG